MNSTPPVKKFGSKPEFRPKLDIKNFDANAARRICLDIEQDKHAKALDAVLNSIAQVATQGAYSLNIFQLLAPGVVDALEDKGFHVSHDTGQNGVTITW